MPTEQNYLEPVEEKNTRWHNPLSVEQRVDIHHGTDPRPTRYRWAPGETKEISSRYDYAIHRVHNGVIIGGLAPQLVKLGSDEKLDPALDTEAVKKKQAEFEAAQAVLTKKQAEETLIVATAKAAEASDAIAAKVEAAEKPLPPERRPRS